MNRLRHSLHARLGLVLSLMLMVLWLSLWLGSGRIADNTAASDVDDQLRATAISLARITVARRPVTPAVSSARAGTGGPDLLYFEVREDGAGVLVHSRDYPTALSETQPGFSDRRSDGRAWRVYTWREPASQLTVRVATHAGAAVRRSADLREHFSRPLLWFLPVLVAVAAITLWQGLSPLRAINQRLARQQPRDLQPLDLDRRQVPLEMRRLLDTLDALFARVADLMDRQRLFAAGAAHELRTPVAACRSQAEVAERSRDPAQIQRAATRIRQTIDRMSALVSQLLLLSRADGREILDQATSVDLQARVAQAIARAKPAAAEAEVTLIHDTPDTPAPVLGDADLLDCVADNLIANAIAFSPRHAAVNAAVVVEPEGVLLTVTDRGPGIGDSDHRLYDAFYRAPENRHDNDGSGLGLTVVKTIVENHGGRIDLVGARAGGTVARVRLPRERPTRDHV